MFIVLLLNVRPNLAKTIIFSKIESGVDSIINTGSSTWTVLTEYIFLIFCVGQVFWRPLCQQNTFITIEKPRSRTCMRTAAYEALNFVRVFSAVRVGSIIDI